MADELPEDNRESPTADSSSATKEAGEESRLAKIQILSDELDRVRESSLERTRGNVTKASFAAVSAGLVISAFSSQIAASGSGLLDIIPMIPALGCLIFTIMATWPRSLGVPSGSKMVEKWLDSGVSPTQLAEKLLRVKCSEAEKRNDRNQKNSLHLKVSFWFLLTSLACAMGTFFLGFFVDINVTMEWK